MGARWRSRGGGARDHGPQSRAGAEQTSQGGTHCDVLGRELDRHGAGHGRSLPFGILKPADGRDFITIFRCQAQKKRTMAASAMVLPDHIATYVSQLLYDIHFPNVRLARFAHYGQDVPAGKRRRRNVVAIIDERVGRKLKGWWAKFFGACSGDERTS